MKSLLPYILFLLPVLAGAQRYDWRRPVMAGGLSGLSGGMWGFHEAISHHWSAVEARFPNINQRFFNPAKSWDRRKVMGYKFDAKHLAASGAQAYLFGAGLVIHIGEKRPLKYVALDVAISAGAYTIANVLVYDGLF